MEAKTLEPRKLATITKEMLEAYAEASGDDNPIHLDENEAKKAGLPGIIAHGMLVASLAANRATQFQREELGSGWQISNFQVRFNAMTFVEDELWVGGRGAVQGVDHYQLRLDAKNQENQLLARLRIQFKSSQDLNAS